MTEFHDAQTHLLDVSREALRHSVLVDPRFPRLARMSLELESSVATSPCKTEHASASASGSQGLEKVRKSQKKHRAQTDGGVVPISGTWG